MRADSTAFAGKNLARSKRPRYVVELAFDSANTLLWYFTSHADAALPVGAAAIAGVLERLSGTSQALAPDEATASIGAITFKLTDKGSVVTSQLGAQLALGRSTRRQRVRVYVGYEGLAWADYALVQTQLVTDIGYADGSYQVRCMDVQREMRKDIFDLAKTTLAQSLSATATTVEVYDTSAFQMVVHGAAYSDAPNATVGYLKIQDERIRYTGKTPTQFTGCTRGALNTRPVEHPVDATATPDRREAVEEYVYLEVPAVKTAYALLTGRMPPLPLELATNNAANDYTTWAAGVTPSGWTLNQDVTGEATFAVRAGPNGDNEVVMCCKSLDTPAGDPGADGGWNTPSTAIPVDKTKPYLFTCFFKRLSTGANSNGQAYWGMNSNSAGFAYVLDLAGTTNNNPYFCQGQITSFMPNADQWYLAVGYVHENGYGSTDTNLAGVYDLNGTRVFTGTEFKWPSDVTACGHRAYHYYNQAISGEIQQMARPRVWQVSVADAPALIRSIVNSVSLLPTKWHLGIDPAYVKASDFTSKLDLYDPRDERRGFITRFEALGKTDGKKFIETELSLLLGAFMPIYASGALGFRRMANILAGAGYVQQLGPASVVEAGELVHDFESLHNILQVSWNWEPLNDGFTRANVLVDQSSITVHGSTEPLRLEFRGLHGSRHSQVTLAGRFDALRDRYSGPPLRLPLRVLPSCNGLEVGDVVRVRLPSVRDFVANGTLDRSFEIQGIKMDWVSGQMNLDLFASSQAPGALTPSSDANVLAASWYTSQGTDLASALTITGSNPGHVSANGTLTGSSDMTAAPSIFYYNGDLQIDSGITVNLAGNVQLRVKGFLQNNGTINGKGGGIAGAAAVGSVIGGPSELFHYNAGTPGFLGTTEAGGGGQIAPAGSGLGQLIRILISTRGAVISGLNSVVPAFNLSWDGSVLAGVPTDLRGSSGSSGMPAWFDATTFDSGGGNPQPGGAGGAGGAGLVIVSRGFAQGASAKIDLSGGDGAVGTTASINHDGSRKVQSGSGAGGAPGGLLVVLDGAGVSATGLSDAGFVALNGKTPVPPGVATETPRVSSLGGFKEPIVSSMFVGTGDGTTFALPNLSGARGGSRVQYVPNNSPATITPDPSAASLAAPSNIGLASGTSELLLQGDGTVIVRIKVTWTSSPDARVAGYDLQFKKSADSIWASAPSVVGQASSTGWISGVQDAVAYDVRVRAGGATREVSDWVTVTNYNVVGKTAKPANVGTLTFVDPVLTWDAIADPDRAGYIVKYRTDGGSDWASAFLAHKDDYVTATRFDTGQLVGGTVKFLVKARDTSKNESTTAASIDVDLRPSEPATFLISRQPDGTRQFDWTHSAPSDLDGYQIRYFLGSTADWNAMTPLHTGLQTASPFETNQLSAGTYTFAIKSVDRAGNSSANAKFITSVTIGDPRIAGAIEDFKEEPAWSGTKTNCSVDAASGWLMADDNGTTWATLPATWAGWTSWVNNPFGTITYVRQIDIGVKTKFVPLVTVTGDGTQTIEEQHSDDNITYSSYAAVGPQVDARYIRIRLTLADAFPKAKSMRIILSANPIEETIQDLATSSLTGSFRIGTGDIRLPITKTYTTIKSVHVALQNVGAGWSWELIDKTTTFGPRIKIYNAANALADATIDADITGI